jgi:hypothetical protein
MSGQTTQRADGNRRKRKNRMDTEDYFNENADNKPPMSEVTPAPKKQDPREYWAGFPEAPFSDTFKWVDEQGYEHMTTIRGWQFQTMLSTIQRATSMIADFNGRPINNRPHPAPAPLPDKAAAIAMEAGNKELAQQLQESAADVPAAPDGKQWNTYGASFVKILPQPDNKVTIEFYGKDRKTPHNDYPELKVNKWDVSQAQGLMKHVTSADVSKPAEFALSCTVYWLDGKEYTSTNGDKRRYKNVAHVRPL